MIPQEGEAQGEAKVTLRVSGLQVVKALQGMNDTGIRGPSHLVRRQILESTRGNLSLSLHRVEGLGRGMAEALQLGVDVIATAYGGNTDFCAGPLAHPVCRWPRVGRA